MLLKNKVPGQQVPSNYLVQLLDFTHRFLQNDESLCYGNIARENLHIIYKDNSPVISYGGLWTPRKKIWPENIRIYPLLCQQAQIDLNYEIRLCESSHFGYKHDFFSLTYYPDQGVAYGAIPDSECDKIRLEILNMAKTRKHIKVR